MIDPKIIPIFLAFFLYENNDCFLRLNNSFLRQGVFGVGNDLRIPNLMSFIPESEGDVWLPPGSLQ